MTVFETLDGNIGVRINKNNIYFSRFNPTKIIGIDDWMYPVKEDKIFSGIMEDTNIIKCLKEYHKGKMFFGHLYLDKEGYSISSASHTSNARQAGLLEALLEFNDYLAWGSDEDIETYGSPFDIQRILPHKVVGRLFDSVSIL